MKKLISLILFLSFVALTISAQFYHIDFSTFPESPDYRSKVDEFFSIYNIVAIWTAQWNYDVPKEKAAGMLVSLIDETDKMIRSQKTENEELLLFRALLKHCCYNLDVGSYHLEIITELEALKKKYPADYRPCWLLANHFSHAVMPFEAMEEFDYLLHDLGGNKFAVDLIQDYIGAAFFALLYSRCQVIIDQIADANAIEDKEEISSLYPAIQRQLQNPPVGAELSGDMIYRILDREEESGLLSRPFGIWIPLEEDWKIAPAEISKEGIWTFSFSFVLQNKKGAKITSNVTILCLVNPARGYEVFRDAMKTKLKNVKTDDGYEPHWDGEFWEFSDPELYPEMGGGHGLILSVNRPEPEYKGIVIEAPAKIFLPKGKSGVQYYTLNDGYTRYDGEIYYMIMLDTCEDVYDEARKIFLAFLDKLLLD